MYNFEISGQLKDKMCKLSKKNKLLHEQLLDKIKEIVNSYDIQHYKNLKYKLKDSKRVHLGHFVLIFHFEKSINTIFFDDFDHHDEIYT